MIVVITHSSNVSASKGGFEYGRMCTDQVAILLAHLNFLTTNRVAHQKRTGKCNEQKRFWQR